MEEPTIRARFQEFEFNSESGELWLKGVPVRLPPQPAKVLRLLVERAGNLVTREEIQRALWADETYVDFDQGLNYCIRQLRIALKDNADQPSYIATVPRRGYRFVAAVQAADDPSTTVTELSDAVSPANAESVVSEPAFLNAVATDAVTAPETLQAASGITGRLRNHWGAVAALILIAVFFATETLRRTSSTGNGPKTMESAGIPTRISVAVLGFTNLDRQESDAWLSTALSEMFSTELAEGGRLRLVSGEDVARVHSASLLPQSLSRESLDRLRQQLGADMIVSGSYTVLTQNHLRKLRVDLRLQDARTGQTLSTVSRTATEPDLFELVSDAGGTLRQQLGVGALTPPEEVSLNTSLPSDERARRLYIEGLEKLRRSDALNARDLLEQVTKIEPHFAPARSSLAAAWSALGYDAKAVDEARKATELATGMSREDQLSIEARYDEMAQARPKAIETLHTLVSFFPDSIDYGLRLANVQMLADKSNDALGTLANLRKLPPPLGTSPRIDVLEALIRAHDGDFKLALHVSEEAVRKARSAELQLLVAQALIQKASALERLGSPDASLEASAEAGGINTEAGFPKGVAMSLLIGGDALSGKGDFVGARIRYESALGVFREIGDKKNSGLALERIGNTFHDQGKFAESQGDYARALETYREIDWKYGIASALGNLSNTLDALGDLKGSLKMHQEALQLFQQTGQKRGTASEIGNIAVVQTELGDLDAAAASHRTALNLHRQIGYRHGEMYALSGLGDIYLLQNKLDAAETQYKAARKLAEETKEENDLARMDLSLVAVAFYRRHYTEAEALARSSAARFEKDKDGEDGASANAWLTRTLLMERRPEEAASAARQAEALAEQSTALPQQFEVSLAVCQLQAATGNSDSARKRVVAILERSRKGGYEQYSLEARRILISLNRDKAKSQLSVLKREAEMHGFMLIADEIARMPDTRDSGFERASTSFR